MFKMDDEDPGAVVSGDVETIVIKPESLELLFEAEDPIWSEEELSEDSDLELTNPSYDECCFVTYSGEIVTINNEDIVKTPFYLESYFIDYDFQSRSKNVIEIDRITCYECDIVFCNEDRLLEHLMTHIDIYRMGCNICDKNLSIEEKFQLHMMAVTWQSVYYCDFCRKSCAGVVRSKSQPPPLGKIYVCHDCEYQTKQLANMQNGIHINESTKAKPVRTEPPPLLPLPSLIPIQQELPSHTEVLQDHKQKPNGETKYEEYENRSTQNASLEGQDCVKLCKLPPKKKENKKCRTPKPRVQVVSESMKSALKLTTKTRARNQNKLTRSYNCSFCPSSFSENFGLMAHLRERHELHKLRYVCNMCGKDFKQQRCYENHMSFHQVSKNHMCFVCNLAFLSKCELEQHAKLHDKSEIINVYCDSVALDLRKKKSRTA